MPAKVIISRCYYIESGLMEILDLRTKKCPMSLVTLKRYLLLHENSCAVQVNKTVHVLFSNESAMQDIILYLDKKAYDYSVKVSDIQVSLVMQIKAQNKN